ncbi:uncharacterized protein RJT21DRAFT_142133 [Scheffersomyces amazonensis]|uniref:uncharacterized protein n=1 Tax=Scheffersomyces amazonensis TaxID=1078765 RepID=UPI00315C9391
MFELDSTTSLSSIEKIDNPNVAPLHLTLPLNQSVNSKPLHETVLNNFNKTQTGKIYEKDIKDIYSMMLICLNLSDSNKSRFNIPIKKKHFPYSFHCDTALNTMENLLVSVELSTATTSISYNIKHDLGFALLKKFYEAKLLHSPADRTRSEPKNGVVLQPTPKGVSILSDFCKKIGMKRSKFPPILSSTFNSMDLFKFDRDALTDKIIYSDYFLHLLFIKLFGDSPNVWTSKNPPDQLPSRDEITETDIGFGFKISHDKYDGFASIVAPASISAQTFGGKSRTTKSHHEEEESPFYHRFFTNPDSDSHVQYYVSYVGVRLIKDKVFRTNYGKEVTIPYVATGKAICQWLCDCTDVMSQKHAKEIASLLLKSKLIKPILFSPSQSQQLKFCANRDCFYTLSKFGEEVCYWNKPSKRLLDLNSPNFQKMMHYASNESSLEDYIDKPIETKGSKMSLSFVINDPGTRYLFRKHLEKELCSENLDAYLQLELFEKSIKRLRKLLGAKSEKSGPEGEFLNQQLINSSNVTLSLAYHIFFSYLSSEAPFVLNIDYRLRAKITSLMIKADSNISPIDAYRDYLKTPTMKFTFGKDIDSQLTDSKPRISSTTEEEQAQEQEHEHEQEEEADDTLNSEELETGIIANSKNIRSQDIYYESKSYSSSVNPIDMDSTLGNLNKISQIFQEISKHIYRLMEVDSFPKFLSSTMYRDAFEI